MKKLTVVWRPGDESGFRVDFIEVSDDYDPYNPEDDEFEHTLHQTYLEDEDMNEVWPDGIPAWDLCAVFMGHVYPE